MKKFENLQINLMNNNKLVVPRTSSIENSHVKKSFSREESQPKKSSKNTLKPNPNLIPNPNRLFQYLDSHSKYQKSFKTKIRQL